MGTGIVQFRMNGRQPVSPTGYPGQAGVVAELMCLIGHGLNGLA